MILMAIMMCLFGIACLLVMLWRDHKEHHLDNSLTEEEIGNYIRKHLSIRIDRHTDENNSIDGIQVRLHLDEKPFQWDYVTLYYLGLQ